MSAGTLPLSERLRVLVVDDNDGFRGSLTALLCGEDMEVVGEAADGAEAIERARELSPDVVLMDIRMPGMDGIEATRRLKVLRPSVEVVALTGLEEQRAVRDMLVAGAAGYVLKDSDGDQIVNAVRRAADGGALLSPSVTPTVIDELIEALERERRRTRQLEIAQEALLERGARRQQLIGRVGHELRTPVTVLLGLAQALRRGGLAPEQLDTALDTLVARAEGLARLVRRFEAALEAGLTEWVNVTELAREVAGRDPRVGVEAPATPVMTALNRTAGIRILEELLENALAFSPAASDVVIRVTLTAGTTEVRVIDRGNGIDPESVARIFEPLEQEQDLHTRTHQGLGLGLSLARLSARAMDGDVTLESTGLAGSTFLWSVAGGSAELDDLPARAAATG
jgi:DNA-binding NarL/FixJ family response regulator/anti-sigma regulatory factor (Ser/Thr protein kinase)